MRFTKEERQRIIAEFAVRHNGHYNPKLFLDEVRATGEDHPAFGWFTWDEARAAEAHRLWESRVFASGLRVSFSIDEIGRRGAVTVREVMMPFAISPVGTRDKGGGYVVSVPGDDGHMLELCSQALTDLGTWIDRYAGAVMYAGGSIHDLRKIQAALAAKTRDAAA